MTNIHRFIALTALCSSLLVACGEQQTPVEKAAESAQAHAEAAEAAKAAVDQP